MANRSLNEAILDQGIRNENFFNGRLLTAGDLTAEQTANSQHHWQLGQAAGEGVVRGLEVSLLSNGATDGVPVVSVTAGLALNRTGQAVALPMDLQLQLTRVAESAGVLRADLFDDCEREGAGPEETGDGVYILLARPVSAYQENAPKREVGSGNQVIGCGSRYITEGIEFRMERLDITGLTRVSSTTRTALAGLLDKALTDAERAKLRNWLAHVCFGTEQIFETASGTEGLAGFPDDPFALQESLEPFHSIYDSYGAVDAMRDLGQVSDGDVPLALICWTRRGFQFVDPWSVRRPLTTPLVEEPWPIIAGARREAEAAATFLQFQDQVQEILLSETGAPTMRATDRFQYLPAGGYLKVGGSAFSSTTFFQGLGVTTATIEAAFVRSLLHDSWYVEPMNLTATPLVTVYSVTGHPEYVVFVRGEKAPPAPEEPPPPSGPKTGRAVIDVTVNRKDFEVIDAVREAIDAREDNERNIFDRLKEKQRNPKLRGDGDRLLLEENLFKVTLKDEHGVSYPLKFVSSKKINRFETRLDLGTLGQARFTSDDLPPGSYTATVQVKGFIKASQEKVVNAGATTTFTFKLKRAKEPPKPGTKTPPDKRAPGDFVGPGIKEIQVVEGYKRHGWPPEGWEEIPPLGDPPDFIGEFMDKWAEHFGGLNPGDPIDPGDGGIYLNPGYDAHAVAEEPYAYMAFGPGGVYVPLVLTTTDYGVDHPVSASKSGLGGIDQETSERLSRQGIDSVDTVAGGWRGLISDTLGVSSETAGNLITEARDKSRALIGSLQQFSGVDGALEQSLQNAGIDGPSALANASAADLAQRLELSPTFAQRLIDQARNSVPSSEWSLGSSNLGLRSQEVETLHSRGITTLKQLRDSFTNGTDQDKASLAQALNRSVGELSGAVETIAVKSGAQLKTERLESAPLTSVPGVTRGTMDALRDLNLRTVGDLAGAQADVVSRALGGDSARATNIIGNAATFRNIGLG
jgi:hypothetical protein